MNVYKASRSSNYALGQWIIEELSVTVTVQIHSSRKDQLFPKPQINDHCQRYASNLSCQVDSDLARYLQYHALTLSLKSHRATLLPVEHNNDDGQCDYHDAKHSNDRYNSIEGC